MTTCSARKWMPHLFMGTVCVLLVPGCGNRSETNPIGAPPGDTGPVAALLPQAKDDSFAVREGQPLVVTGSGVLTNDTPQGAALTLDSGPSLGKLDWNGDGSFTYTPNEAAAAVSDSFRYRLSNAAGTSTATVTLPISVRRFYVKNDGPNGDGRLQTPFNNSADAISAAAGVADAEIVFYRGDGTAHRQNTDIHLEDSQTLRSYDPAQPALLSGQVYLANQTGVLDLKLSGNLPNLVASGIRDVQLRNLEIQTTGDTQGSIHCTDLTGVLQCNNTTITTPGIAIRLTNSSGSLQASLDGLRIQASISVIWRNTGNAEISWTERGSRIQIPDNDFNPSGWFLDNQDNVRATALFQDCRCQGTGRVGMDASAQQNSRFDFAFENGYLEAGVWLSPIDHGSLKARFTNVEMAEGYYKGISFNAEAAGPSSSLAFRLQNVTSPFFDIRCLSSNPVVVENLNHFTDENFGLLSTTGAVVHAEPGTQGIP